LHPSKVHTFYNTKSLNSKNECSGSLEFSNNSIQGSVAVKDNLKIKNQNRIKRDDMIREEHEEISEDESPYKKEHLVLKSKNYHNAYE
jgi:hypothetical protein